MLSHEFGSHFESEAWPGAGGGFGSCGDSGGPGTGGTCGGCGQRGGGAAAGELHGAAVCGQGADRGWVGCGSTVGSVQRGDARWCDRDGLHRARWRARRVHVGGPASASRCCGGGGFIVGGTAAVPDAKVAGRDLTRLAGTDRWHTARLVGNQARSLAGDDSSAADASAGAEDPTTDCTGDVPIVAASDDAAQSDLYSAVTLAGVIGTDCIVLAGARDESMPSAQRTRLDAAAPGGFIVGGRTAVPDAKLASREMTRLAGADRWNTAQLVGAKTRSAAGSPGTGDDSGMDLAAGFASVSVAYSYSCGLRLGGSIDCWGSDWYRQVSDVPNGEFSSISTGPYHACGLRLDGTIDCWGLHTSEEDPREAARLQNGRNGAPEGRFTAVSVGVNYTCGLRADGGIECWGRDQSFNYRGASVRVNLPPDGNYSEVSAGNQLACALRMNGSIVCWGAVGGFSGAKVVAGGMYWSPSGEFISVSAGGSLVCGLRPSGQVECWGYGNRTADHIFGNPSGEFAAVSVGYSGACGIRSDGRLECWRAKQYYDVPKTDSLDGKFERVSFSGDHVCGLRTSSIVECAGDNDTYQSDPHVRDNPALGFRSLENSGDQGGTYGRGLRDDATFACWDLIEYTRDDEIRGLSTWSRGYSREGFSREQSGFGIGDVTALLGSDVVIVLWSDGRVTIERLSYRNSRTASVRVIETPISLDGRYSAIDRKSRFANGPITCLLRTDGRVVCITARGAIVDKWTGRYKSIGGRCGVLLTGQIACQTPEGDDTQWWQSDIPSGKFRTVQDNASRACAIRVNGSLACWGDWQYYDSTLGKEILAKPPSGTFTHVDVAAPGSSACAIRTDGTLACWGNWDRGSGRSALTIQPPAGSFTDVYVYDAQYDYACGVRVDTSVVCWGSNLEGSPVH